MARPRSAASRTGVHMQGIQPTRLQRGRPRRTLSREMMFPMKLPGGRPAREGARPAWRPIPAWWWMLAAVAAVVIVAFVVTTWLLTIASGAKPGTEQANSRLDAVRTGLAAGAGAGAAVGLMLAFRRQHHQEIATDLTDRDATERRITELYTKAVEQLGNDKAPVRFGGLYALERLAQDNPAQRQTIVNVICAYLRMPFAPEAPTGKPKPEAAEDPGEPDTETETGTDEIGDTWRQERQVRLTAQRILAEHLRDDRAEDMRPTDPPSPRFWPDIHLDLADATLIDFNFVNGVMADANFDGATFRGDHLFDGATFTGIANFSRAAFSGEAGFDGATFRGDLLFNGATFTGIANFSRAAFTGEAGFDGATFREFVSFYGATFRSGARFGNATLSNALFDGATFRDYAGFDEAIFSGKARFSKATFRGEARFSKATFRGEAVFEGAIFRGDARFGNAILSSAGFGGATFSSAARFGGATFSSAARFGGATFSSAARFDGVTFSGGEDSLSFGGSHVRSQDAEHVWPTGWRLEPDGNGGYTVVRANDDGRS